MSVFFPDFSVVSWGEGDFIAEFGLWRFGLFGVSRRFGEIVGFRKKLGAGRFSRENRPAL